MTEKNDRLLLKEILDLVQLKKLFGHFSCITSLDVALFDNTGREVLVNRKDNSVCQSAKNCRKCREYISDGSLRSSELGEPYICACGCGLIMCFSPVVYKERLIGSIACGPTVLWEADDVAKKEFLDKTADMNIHVSIDKLFKSITSCTCINMTGAAQILFIIINSLTREHSIYLDQRAKITMQQAKITELLIERKNKTPYCSDYPAEREKELLICVQNGNTEQSRKILDILLGEIFAWSGGNLETFKIRLLELIALLSRSASDTDSPVPEIDKITKNSFDVILGETDFELICFLTGQAVEEFTGIIGHKGPKILSDNLLKAVNHIALHYSEDLSLKDIADIVFVSAYYLSHLFRKELNTTFSDYLCKIRVEKAKDMLKKGEDLRINEIAEQTGFHNPNYFTTLFKKATGMPPREYRNFFR